MPPGIWLVFIDLTHANAFDKEPSMARINALLDRWEAELGERDGSV